MHAHATLLVELGGVVFALGVLGRLAAAAGLSAVPLYLIAGLAFGRGGLLPLGASSTFLSTGADIGVVLLLLTLGLEHSADELLGTLRSSAPAGLVDMLLNALPGLAARDGRRTRGDRPRRASARPRASGQPARP